MSIIQILVTLRACCLRAGFSTPYAVSRLSLSFLPSLPRPHLLLIRIASSPASFGRVSSPYANAAALSVLPRYACIDRAGLARDEYMQPTSSSIDATVETP